MTEKHSEELACKMEPSDPENTVGSEEINLAKSRFNILDLLENSSKQSHGSPSASSDGHESETPAVPMFNPRVALPQLAALFHHGILPGVVPITPALAHPGLPFLPWVPVQAIPKVDSSPNSQSETNSKQGGDMSHSGVRDENKDLRNSMGGSPLDSDVEEDDEENGDGRGSDDDGHQDVNGSNRKKKTRTVFSRHQVSQLEMTFDMKRYLSSGERAHLAQKLHLSETQVKIWFQNRRNKFKRQSNTGEESTLQTHRANMFAGLSSDRLPQLPAHLLPAVSSPMTLRPIALPAPLDPSAAARLLFSYGALAAQVHNIM